MTARPGRHSAPLLIALAVGALLAGVGSVVGAGSLPAGLASVLGMSPPPGPAPPLGSALPAPSTTAPDLTPPGLAPPTSFAVAPAPAPPTTRPAPRSTVTTPRPPSPTPQRPTTTAKPVPAPAAGPAAQVVELTNQERARNGCAALRIDARITAAAQKHSADMSANGYFDHDSQDGRTFDERIRAEGYPSPGAENIAQGQRSAAEVVEDWMNSPGHRRNILDCSLTTIGVGYAPTGSYWTQDFGR